MRSIIWILLIVSNHRVASNRRDSFNQRHEIPDTATFTCILANIALLGVPGSILSILTSDDGMVYTVSA